MRHVISRNNLSRFRIIPEMSDKYWFNIIGWYTIQDTKEYSIQDGYACCLYHSLFCLGFGRLLSAINMRMLQWISLPYILVSLVLISPGKYNSNFGFNVSLYDEFILAASISCITCEECGGDDQTLECADDVTQCLTFTIDGLFVCVWYFESRLSSLAHISISQDHSSLVATPKYMHIGMSCISSGVSGYI